MAELRDEVKDVLGKLSSSLSTVPTGVLSQIVRYLAQWENIDDLVLDSLPESPKTIICLSAASALVVEIERRRLQLHLDEQNQG